MALKDDAYALADNLQALANTARQIAEVIPAPQHFDGDSPGQWGAPPPGNSWKGQMPVGKKIGRLDRNGKKLRVGDVVRVYDSERYGNPMGTVTGPGHDHGDGKERVTVRLHNGANDEYMPSTGRIVREHRYDDVRGQEATDEYRDEQTNGHGKPTNGDATERIIVGLFESGGLRVGIEVPPELAHLFTP